MKSALFVLMLPLALTACAAVVEPIAGPNGRQGYEISCDGAAYSWSKCYNAAAKTCGGAYDIISTNGTSTPTAYGPLVTRSLVVSCKG
ncbi:hypothetical protein LMG8323_01625 [Ralstonia mannitolilytica]|nr:hypothetical protein LMG8323_01625 [Ralstonia mannitolilytica]